eukprot:TRINITY_DN10279_c0_g2_i1.p1 TRINITY_DN10279_c0_g2~~TRINITY_DN10279_c0_g2_i1.p1  ORF type:complete len:899 (-),score=184.57 TRINITY_DN10279_c0_g2_i1:357-2942(-)
MVFDFFSVISVMKFEIAMILLAGILYLFTMGSVRKKPSKQAKTEIAEDETQDLVDAKDVEQPDQVEQAEQIETSNEDIKEIIQNIENGDIEIALASMMVLPSSAKHDLKRSKVFKSLLFKLSTERRVTSEVLDQLKDLCSKEVLDAKDFDYAAVKATYEAPAEACARLLLLGGQIGIPRRDRAIKILLRAHVYTLTTFRNLIKDVLAGERELSKSLFHDLTKLCKTYEDWQTLHELQDGPGLELLFEEDSSTAKFIKRCGREGLLAEAIKAFEGYQEELSASGKQPTVALYNILLHSCFLCKAPSAVASFFTEMQQEELVPDVQSYNLALTAYAELEEFDAVRSLFAQMKAKGLTPTYFTYRRLIQAAIGTGDHALLWSTVTEAIQSGFTMGVQAREFILQGITMPSQEAELKHFLTVFDAETKFDLGLTMDSQLFKCFMDACVRAKAHDLLWQQVQIWCVQSSMVKITAPICGSMIKLFGQASKPDKVWQVWFLMASRDVQPSPVTVGCMVEALVANRLVEDAWKLVNGLWEDETKRNLVNTVIYANIMKGFGMLKCFDQAVAVHNEMVQRGIPANRVFFNTTLNAMANSNKMDKVPELLHAMREADPPIRPCGVTYSTLMKGFCNAGHLEKGLELLEEMKHLEGDEEIEIDELVYSVLLQGCVRRSDVDTGMKLFNDMKATGIIVSNYSLSILCKLLGGAKQPEKAVAIMQEMSCQYGYRPNIQVCTALVQGFIDAGNYSRACSLYNHFVSNRVCVPDEKMYSNMTRAFLMKRSFQEAAEVIRCAYHLPGCNKLQVTRGVPKGCEIKFIHQTVFMLGYSNPAGQQLVNDLSNSCNIKVTAEDCNSAHQVRKKKPLKFSQ